MMNKPLLDKRVFALLFLAAAILPANADSAAADAAPPSAQPSSSLDAQLSDLVKQVVVAANAGKGKIVLDAISQQYRDAGEKVIKAFGAGKTMDQTIVLDFNTYSINGIDRVIVDKDIAYVEAKITYHPEALPDVVQDEKDNASNEPDGDLWASMGGDSSANTREKGGVGLATYYLVMQKGAWKIHSTYFSLEPMTASELDKVSKNMKTLVLQ
jgi:hypothetical protein